METSENSLNGWTVHGRPGYFGSRRDATIAHWDQMYGPGAWKLAWKIRGAFVEWLEAITHYEESYYHFFVDNPEILEMLCGDASDVYDDNVTNVNSKLDYSIQETNRTHIQDIAIRRCVQRLGQKFEGSQLVQIRHAQGKHPLSLVLSPGIIPFYEPGLIESPELTGWWRPGTVESYYQSNKYLLVRADVTPK